MLKIRPATAADVTAIAQIHVASWQTTYAGHLPAAVIATHTYAQRYQQWQRCYRQDHALVAVQADQVVGFVTGGAQRSHPDLQAAYPAEVYGLYLTPTLQRQGIGRQLFQAKRTELGTPFTLDCLANNHGARRFYQAQGGQPLRAGHYRTGDQEFATTVIGFSNSY